MKFKMFVVVFSFIVFGSIFGVNVYAQAKKTVTKKEAAPSPVKKVEEKPVEIAFPDATVGRLYMFVLVPANFSAPYKISIVSGSLPSGLAINQKTGGIEGQPDKQGVWNTVLSVTDSKSKKGTFSGVIRVWRMLTIGEHGQFKGFDGFQMALNMAQDMDEIRIEKGIIEASGLVVPQNKEWNHGIKISGGWNETFNEKSNKPEDTSLDGNGKETSILTISNNKDKVLIENLIFRNSNRKAAVYGSATFTKCIFRNNSAGAAIGTCVFSDCEFMDNSAYFGGLFSGNGGAVKGGGTFSNCSFTRNSAADGGAVEGGGIFSNCTFTSNSGHNGGAVCAGGNAFYMDAGGTFSNCIFTNNSVVNGKGGAAYGGGTFSNCTFTNNSVSNGSGGAVCGNGTFSNCSFLNNSVSEGSGGAVIGNGTFSNCSFIYNSTNQYGGAV